MKKLTYLILCIAIVSVSCSKPQIPICCGPPPQRSAAMTAQKNGVTWNPPYVIATHNISTISITSENVTTSNDTRIDTLNINFEYTAADTGTYKLNNGHAYYAIFTGGVPVAYKLDTTFNNYIKVSSYQRLDNATTTNPNSFEIGGTFNLKFIDPNNPTGITFTNGIYYAIMNQ